MPSLAFPIHRIALRCGQLSTLALCIAAFPACDKKKAPAAPAKKVPVAKKIPEVVVPNKVLPTPPRIDLSAAQIATSQSDFATKLFGIQAKKTKLSQNLVLSPMSVYLAVGLTRLGALGKTAELLDMALELPTGAGSKAVARALGQAQRSWSATSEGSELALANRLFASESFKIQPGYVEMSRSSLGADIQNLAFARQAQAARKTINDWVESQTKGRIKDLLAPADVGPSTLMVLVNAIWFKGQWAKTFDKAKTKKLPFRLQSGKSISVPTMQMSHDFALLDDSSKGYRALDLPYADGKLAMTIILPEEKTSIEQLQSRIDLQDLSQRMNQAMPRKVSLRLPKFKIEAKAAADLRPALKEMGADTMFGDPSPDFGALTKEKVAVQKVLHKAMIVVDEQGAEAAAATAVTMYRGSSMNKKIAFHAGRPFLFLIRSKKDHAILFAGRVMQPK